MTAKTDHKTSYWTFGSSACQADLYLQNSGRTRFGPKYLAFNFSSFLSISCFRFGPVTIYEPLVSSQRQITRYIWKQQKAFVFTFSVLVCML